jgi:hypothetical protein
MKAIVVTDQVAGASGQHFPGRWLCRIRPAGNNLGYYSWSRHEISNGLRRRSIFRRERKHSRTSTYPLTHRHHYDQRKHHD